MRVGIPLPYTDIHTYMLSVSPSISASWGCGKGLYSPIFSRNDGRGGLGGMMFREKMNMAVIAHGMSMDWGDLGQIGWEERRWRGEGGGKGERVKGH